MRDVESPETFDLKNYFPDFLWLLRDAILSVPPGPDGKPMTPTEYLKTKIFKRGKSFNETESDKISRAILTVFPSIECMTIETPSADPEVMRDIAANEDKLNPRFNSQIQNLVAYLLKRVRAKCGFVEGKLLDGPLLAEIASKFLKAVNSPDAIPCISDTWQTAVELRCKKELENMLDEYTRDLDEKIKEVGLPMEEDLLDDGGSSKPHTLMAIHRSILLQKTQCLLKQVGHFVGGPVATADGAPTTITRESLIAELDNAAATFSDMESSVQMKGFEKSRKKVVSGEILYKYTQLNLSESRSQCEAVFAELYGVLEDKMKEMDKYTFKEFSSDLTALQQQYYKKAIGPAKWEVYQDKESFIKSQEASYIRLEGFKKEKFEALQKIAEEKARNDHLHDTLGQLQVQTTKDAELNKERMIAMQKQHEEEMIRMKEEQEERLENDRKKHDDLMKAQLDSMAEIVKENKEEMKQQYDVMFKSMEAMSQQNQENLVSVTKTITALNTAIENMRKFYQ